MTQPHDETSEQTGRSFDPQRLRTLSDMRRSGDDKMIAGVCAGAARHLDIDPVILRILLATLTLFGLSGIIIYGAVWLLVPEDGADQSIVGKMFGLGEKEEQFRIAGLIVAAVVAVVSASSLIDGNAFDTPFPYLGVIALLVLWWFVIRPIQRDQRREPGGEPQRSAHQPVQGPVPPQAAGSAGPAVPTTRAAPTTQSVPTPPEPPAGPPPGAMRAGPPAPPPPKPRNPRHDRGALTAATLFAAMIAVGAVWAYALATDADNLPVFLSVAVALAVIGAGMLLGSFVGNGRPLIVFAIIAALAIVPSTVLPAADVGRSTPTPSAADQVRSEYRLGIGDLQLDLSRVSDPNALDGRTITVREGIGSIRVTVPEDVDVDVDARTRGGRIRVFGQVYNGDPTASMHYADPVDDGPDVRLVLRQTAGEVEVSQR